MSALADCYNIADLRKLAKKKLPSVMFDYITGGAEDEITLQRNRNAYNCYQFVPRVLQNVEQIDISVNFLGCKLDIPVFSAPTGMSRMFHHSGEISVVKASHKAGTAYCLSTVSTTSIEEVAEASLGGPLFFQVYAWRNKDMVNDFIKRAKQSGYHGLMLAVDLAALGKRERDLKNGHGKPAVLRRNTALSALIRPEWLFHFLTKPKWKMANMTEYLPNGAAAVKVLDTVNQQFRADVDWHEVAEMMKLWDGPFILKGIQSVSDAIKAAEMGVSGIILSNHGGRQLDGAPTAFELLPRVVKAVGNKTDVFIDGGIERGADIIKAIALGAKACLIGKAYLYGLAAGGEAGVTRTYEILTDEMQRVMKLIGCKSVSELDASYVERVE